MVDGNYAGNLAHPELAAAYYPLSVSFETEVNQEIDPFSEEYFQQQLALYKEISGRELNQWDGELHPVDVPSLVNASNPLGLAHAPFIAEHVRALTTMFTLSSLDVRPNILDMGAGHGVSSEIFAFCGAHVHAVDIDPQLSLLSKVRAAARGYDIRRSTLNFDDLSSVPDNHYSAAFFFQSLHHCLRPWVLIETLKGKIVADGVIAFTGEPVQAGWKNWGIRMDQESIYVARKFGWFESGWSHDFIRECFARNGFTLKFFSGGHGGGEIGVATADPGKLARCVAAAAHHGFAERYPG